MSGSSSIAWSWRHAFALSDLPATTKAVLHTVGMFMNEVGESCYPSVADLCRYSGLDKKTVMKHLAVASEAGWLAISQHGFRGQKWKRNQYAPRWPERDLLSSCPPDDGEKGGGTAPPPSEAEKVVESTVEGGGTEGLKVVEHVHQDKTSPVNIPETSPIERGRASEDLAKTPIATADDPKKYEVRVKRLAERLSWPGWANSSTAWTVARFAELTDAERAEGEAKAPAYLAYCGGKALSLGTYFQQRKWVDLPASVIAAAQAQPPVTASPFGKMWGAMRLAWLLRPSAQLPRASAFLERLMAEDSSAGERERIAHRARHGWPAVNRLHNLAANGSGIVVPKDALMLEAIAASFDKVRVGSDEYQAWKTLHDERGWPWLPDPGRQEWVYFPAGGPGALGAFEQALRGNHDALKAAE